MTSRYEPQPGDEIADALMGGTVTASNSTLMRQAQSTADTYMHAAVGDIDREFGEGFARKHPELIAAYMQTSAIDLGTAIITRALDRLVTAVSAAATGMESIAENVRSDHPLMAETGIASALDKIAESISDAGGEIAESKEKQT
jgi:hypothetical protein